MFVILFLSCLEYILALGVQTKNITMENIASQEMISFVSRRIRKLSTTLKALQPTSQVASVLQVMVSYLRELCQKRRFKNVQHVLDVVGQLYEKGDREIRQGIEYLFLHCLSRMDHLCDQKQWHLVINHLPLKLREVYILQHIK